MSPCCVVTVWSRIVYSESIVGMLSCWTESRQLSCSSPGNLGSWPVCICPLSKKQNEVLISYTVVGRAGAGEGGDENLCNYYSKSRYVFISLLMYSTL